MRDQLTQEEIEEIKAEAARRRMARRPPPSEGGQPALYVVTLTRTFEVLAESEAEAIEIAQLGNFEDFSTEGWQAECVR